MSAAPSCSSGESHTPLLGDTIGGNFDATVRAFADARRSPAARPGGRPWQALLAAGRQLDRAALDRIQLDADDPRRG